MKYSQAILIACIGASALVSAAPHSYNKTIASTVARRQDDASAVGAPTDAAPPATDATSAAPTADGPPAGPPAGGKHHGKKHHGKKGRKGRRSFDDELFERQDDASAGASDAAPPATDATSAAPTADGPPAGGKHHGKKHHGKKGKKGRRSFDDELFERAPTTTSAADAIETSAVSSSASPTGQHGAHKKSHHQHKDGEHTGEGKKHHHHHKSSSNPSATSSAVASSTAAAGAASTAAPLATREFDEELLVRAIQDELETRGFLSGIAHKAGHLLKGHHSVPNVNVDMSQQDPNNAPAQRSFDDELFERAPTTTSAADATETSAVSSSASPTGQHGAHKKSHHQHKDGERTGEGKKHHHHHKSSSTPSATSSAVASSTAAAGAASTAAPLTTREFDEEFLVRAIQDELEARGFLNGIAHKAGHLLKGHHSVPNVNVDMSQQDPNNAPAQRDFFEEYELDARDFVDYLVERDFEIDELD